MRPPLLLMLLIHASVAFATEAPPPTTRQEAVPLDFMPLAQNVGQILLKVPAVAGGGGEDTKEICTGLAISRTLVITARHCFYEINGGTTAYTGIIFWRGRTGQDGSSFGTRHVIKKEFIENNASTDLVILETEDPMPSGIGIQMEYATEALESGKSLFILHHPGQGSMVLTRFDCRAFDPPGAGQMLRHTCDTSPGSSGAPIFNQQMKLVGFHQRGGKTNDPKTFNLAVSFTRARTAVSKLATSAANWKTVASLELEEISGEYQSDQSNYYIKRNENWSYRVGISGTVYKIYDQSADESYWEFWRPVGDQNFRFPKAGGELMWRSTPNGTWTTIGAVKKIK